MIPIIRVNYSCIRLFGALFVSEKDGKYKHKLQQQICSFFGVDDCLLTSSARNAIFMILKSLQQHKVIVPAYTCEVVIDAVKLSGKEIIFAHVQKDTLNIEHYPEIDSDTVVIATHQYGLPSEMNKLSSLCKKKGAILIEDCAGSLGSIINGQLTGTFGDFGVFSLSASKTLHSPTKGGFIIAKDPSKLKQISTDIPLKPSDGKFKLKQIIKGIGFCINKNQFMNPLISNLVSTKETELKDAYLSDYAYKRDFYEWQAYVVCRQFANLNEIFDKRKRMFRLYDERITNDTIQKPIYNPEAVNIRYSILVNNRTEFISECKRKGIQVGRGYKRLNCPSDYITESEISNKIVYLPFGSDYSDKEIQKVVSIVNSII